VTDQYNVTEAGVSSVSYLFFDGVNDSLATPSINFPAGPTNQTLGPELVTNGDFSSGTTGWTPIGSTLSVVSGALRVTASTSGQSAGARAQISTVVGRTYRLIVTFAADGSTGNSFANAGTSLVNSAYLNANLGSTVGTYTFVFTATETTSFIAFTTSTSVVAGETNDWDNISVREIDAAQAPDKMTVFAGVRKLSDAATGVIAEISTQSGTINGAFGQFAASGTGFAFSSRGTSLAVASGGASPAPITNVLTGIGDISGDVARLRINGTQAAEALTDQGTGTYGNYPLFIGARNSSLSFFSGHLYSLIVRGAQSNTGQISSTETWVAGKTGIKI
jgi:hypothetical protein